MPSTRVAPSNIISSGSTATRPFSYNTVTIVFPHSVQPSCLTSFTQAIRLQALLEPKNNPSFFTKYRDMATASASVILKTATEQTKSRGRSSTRTGKHRPQSGAPMRCCASYGLYLLMNIECASKEKLCLRTFPRQWCRPDVFVLFLHSLWHHT